jgi:hypothetical protein
MMLGMIFHVMKILLKKVETGLSSAACKHVLQIAGDFSR